MGAATRGSPIPLLLLSFPSRLVSKHNALYENHSNHSFAVYTLALLGTTISVSLSRTPPHPPPRISAPAFLLVLGRSWAVAKLTHQRGGRGLEEVWKRFSLPLAKKVAK